MSSTVLDIVQQSTVRLGAVDSPRLSAEVLVAHSLGLSRLGLVMDRDRILSDDEVCQIDALISRRERGEPVAYILGEKEFYGLGFKVTPDVLIPRPETELIVEEVEKLFDSEQVFCFADLGTGSGILAITITSLFPSASCLAMDISSSALEVARANARRHGVEDRIRFVEGDFTQEIQENGFDLIVSNPPYVTQHEYDVASSEVVDFEPETALVSGIDGLDHVRKMVSLVSSALTPGGYFLMEMGCDQWSGAKKIMCEQFSLLESVNVLRDLAGLDRVVFVTKQ